MSDSDKFSVEITAEEGREDGLLSIKNTARRHCDVLAYAVSRERYEKSIRKQDAASKELRKKLNCSGVYILWGPCDAEDDGRIYLGKSDGNFEGKRLVRHRTEKKWWRQVVIFTSRSKDNPLHGSQIDYLEAELCRRAREVGRSSVDNGNTPGHPTNISARDLEDIQAFLEEAISFLPMIGINAFLELDKPKKAAPAVQDKPPTIEDQPFLAVGRPMRLLFEEFSKQVVAINSSVVEVFTKYYVSYKLKKKSKQKNFVSILVQDKNILVYLENTRDELDDPSGLTATSRGARTWHKAGKFMVPLNSEGELPAVMHLIRQSFGKVADGM